MRGSEDAFNLKRLKYGLYNLWMIVVVTAFILIRIAGSKTFERLVHSFWKTQCALLQDPRLLGMPRG